MKETSTEYKPFFRCAIFLVLAIIAILNLRVRRMVDVPPTPPVMTVDDIWPPTAFLDRLLGMDDGNGADDNTQQRNNNKRRLVLAASNSEYVDFADNFANSLLALNVTNFVLVPLDAGAYEILHHAYPHHTLPLMPGMDSVPEGEATYDTPEFRNLTATRPVLIRAFLEKNYTVLYNDIDMVWQHNAWDAIDQRDNSALTTTNSTLLASTMVWYDGSPDNELCTCLIYVIPTPDKIALIQEWEDEIRNGEFRDDQDAFFTVAQRRNFPFHGGSSPSSDGVHVFLNDEEFPAGNHYSWETQTVNNTKAIIIHNNWIAGKQDKADRFITAGLWKPSGRLASST